MAASRSASSPRSALLVTRESSSEVSVMPSAPQKECLAADLELELCAC